MRVSLGWKRKSKNKDAKLALIRRADTERDTAYSIGGRTKARKETTDHVAETQMPRRFSRPESARDAQRRTL